MLLNKKIKRSGIMLVVSSPSGAGKTTLARELISRDRDINLSISVTTRKPRISEKNNKDYIFVSEKRFTKVNQWLSGHGVTVEEINYKEISKQGGLLRCSTLPLIRE